MFTWNEKENLENSMRTDPRVVYGPTRTAPNNEEVKKSNELLKLSFLVGYF
jgi:hypothetical protein